MSKLAGWGRRARRALADWRRSRQLAMAVCRGTYYAVYFRLFRRNVRVALPFLAYEAVSISGPGTVRIGPFCSVYPNVFRGLSITTLCDSSVVRIGARCSLGGLTIRCRESVVIGDRTMTAHSLIQDVLLFSDPHDQRRYASLDGKIEIGRNAWLGGLTCVLCGTSVGDDSVLSWGAACFRATVPAGAVASGNPVTRALPIDRLQHFGRSARGLSGVGPSPLAL